MRTVSAALALAISCVPAAAQVPGVKHVVLIGVDGLATQGIDAAATPHLDKLIREGAYSFTARAALPTSSSTNWCSMITGASAAQHGVTSNDWERDAHEIEPADTGLEPIFPTVFGRLRQSFPDAAIGVFYDWDGFGRLYEKSAATIDKDANGPDDAADSAISFFHSHAPVLTFIHLDHVDGAGHRYGWYTPPYNLAVEKADAMIGRVMEGLRESGMIDSTIVIVTSDHGGIGKGHGGDSMLELEIPWIISGPGIAKGRLIQRAVNTTDTAATIAHALGFSLSDAAIGRAVIEAFASFPDTPGKAKPTTYIPAPDVQPTPGRFNLPVTDITLSTDAQTEGLQIRYTLDGTEPTPQSPLYTAPLTIESTATLRARCFAKGNAQSRTMTAHYRIVAERSDRGVKFDYFEGRWDLLPNFTALTPKRSGTMPDIDLTEFRPSTDGFGLLITGRLQIDTPGEYTFYLSSDDGSRLHIGGQSLIDNDGRHGVKVRSGKISLPAGENPFKIEYFNGGGGYELALEYTGPGLLRQFVPVDHLLP